MAGPPIFPSLFSDPVALAAASVGRFSCAVTGDEIRESGVVTYDVCDVNAGGLRMDKRSGRQFNRTILGLSFGLKNGLSRRKQEKKTALLFAN